MTPERVAAPSALQTLPHGSSGSKCLQRSSPSPHGWGRLLSWLDRLLPISACSASVEHCSVIIGVFLTSLSHVKANQRLYRSGQPAKRGRAADRHLHELTGFGCPVIEAARAIKINLAVVLHTLPLQIGFM